MDGEPKRWSDLVSEMHALTWEEAPPDFEDGGAMLCRSEEGERHSYVEC